MHRNYQPLLAHRQGWSRLAHITGAVSRELPAVAEACDAVIETRSWKAADFQSARKAPLIARRCSTSLTWYRMACRRGGDRNARQADQRAGIGRVEKGSEWCASLVTR